MYYSILIFVSCSLEAVGVARKGVMTNRDNHQELLLIHQSYMCKEIKILGGRKIVMVEIKKNIFDD